MRPVAAPRAAAPASIPRRGRRRRSTGRARTTKPSGSAGIGAQDSRRGRASPRSPASCRRARGSVRARRGARRSRPSRRAAAAGAPRPCGSSRSRPIRRAPGTASATRCGGRPGPASTAASGFRNQAAPGQPAASLEPRRRALVVLQRPEMDEADVLHVLPLRRLRLEALAQELHGQVRAGRARRASPPTGRSRRSDRRC